MKKLSPRFVSLAAVLCTLLLFSCTTDIEFPPPPGNLSSSSAQATNSSSSSLLSISSGGRSSSSSLRSSSSVGSPRPCGGFEGDEFIDPRDCNSYKYEIAPDGQAWMSENLNYSKNGTIGWCYKTGTDASNLGSAGENLPGCDRPYGRHYTYEIAMDGNLSLNKARGICPEGWHIPNADEWKTRMEKGIRNASAGNYDPTYSEWRNRSSGGFYWYSNAVNGSNLGFVFIWGSTFQVRPLYYFGVSGDLTSLAKFNDYFSVRCILDTDADFTLTCGDEPYDPRTQRCSGVKISYGSSGPSNTPCGGKTVYIELPAGWSNTTYITWAGQFIPITGTKDGVWTKFTLPSNLGEDGPDRQEIVFVDDNSYFSYDEIHYLTKNAIGENQNPSYPRLDMFKCSDFGEVTYITGALVNIH